MVAHIVGKTQHVGIAAEDEHDGAETIDVFAAAQPFTFRERWGIGASERWRVCVVGRLSGPRWDSEWSEIAGAVLVEAERLQRLVDKRFETYDVSEGELSVWQVWPHRIVEQHHWVVFRGSCAGFVEHCFAKADIDLVRDDAGRLPMTSPAKDEAEYIKKQYRRDGAEIELPRLYPSYQLRAVQLDQTCWEPDLRYRWYPEHFDDP